MVTTELRNIFLSASIPLPERDPKYYSTADIIAIRDAVIALATTVLPACRLIWGGHPSITPLIYYVMEKLNLNIQDHVIIYQSKYFESFFPEDNNKFKNVIQTANLQDKEDSLVLMRKTMLNAYKFSAGIFIGGMEGVEIEFKLFKELQPKALLFPIASTGAAAKILYDDLLVQGKEKRLAKDYGYMSLFQELLMEKV